MPSYIDQLVQRVPGSINTKAVVGALLLSACAAAIFPPNSSGDKRQGHSMFSHDKPEAVVKHEEGMREQKRIEREKKGDN
mmetsp:Transcript_9050/g.12043  ORF Transcript_9050/g.12043 Transcript_9050/m.12043 type:complete len:80 (-) Transcript_9050:1245-1484(-)